MVYEVPIDLLCAEEPEVEIKEELELRYPGEFFDFSRPYTAYTKRQYNVLFIEFDD